MPGLKTENGRGINIINNGARTPGFLDLLEEKLNSMGIEPVAPVARLGSDADYCGIGEQYAAEGLFRKVQSAYYFGGGTGIADAMKLDGDLVPFDKTKDWMQKSWQIACSLGPTYEKLISAKSMNETFARMEKSTLEEYVSAGKFAQVEAAKGNPRAKFVMETIATLLAELVFERMYTLHAGRENTPWRGAGYMALNPNHPYRGRFFDKIVLGQRIGAIYADPEYRRILRASLHARMEDLLKNFGSPEMQQVYLKDGKLRAGLFAASKLRQAPAIGAAVDAVRCLMEKK
jgi:hypothetical protein